MRRVPITSWMPIGGGSLTASIRSTKSAISPGSSSTSARVSSKRSMFAGSSAMNSLLIAKSATARTALMIATAGTALTRPISPAAIPTYWLNCVLVWPTNVSPKAFAVS